MESSIQKRMFGLLEPWPMKFLDLKIHFTMGWTAEHTGTYLLKITTTQ